MNFPRIFEGNWLNEVLTETGEACGIFLPLFLKGEKEHGELIHTFPHTDMLGWVIGKVAEQNMGICLLKESCSLVD